MIDAKRRHIVMYAIITSGGKQYRVEKGTKIRVEKLEEREGAEIHLNTVAVFKDGTITAHKTKVRAKVVEHGKGEKIDIFKYKPKKNYRRRMGHRQRTARPRRAI